MIDPLVYDGKQATFTTRRLSDLIYQTNRDLSTSHSNTNADVTQIYVFLYIKMLRDPPKTPTTIHKRSASRFSGFRYGLNF
jgi:hypothetical protein